MRSYTSIGICFRGGYHLLNQTSVEEKLLELEKEKKELIQQNNELIRQLKNFEEYHALKAEERLRDLILSTTSKLENQIQVLKSNKQNDEILQYMKDELIKSIDEKTNGILNRINRIEEKLIMNIDAMNELEEKLNSQKKSTQINQSNESLGKYKQALSVREKNIYALRRRISVLENSMNYILGSALLNSIKKPWRIPAEFSIVFSTLLKGMKRKIDGEKRVYPQIELPFPYEGSPFINKKDANDTTLVTWKSFAEENHLTAKINDKQELIVSIDKLKSMSESEFVVGLSLLISETKENDDLFKILMEKIEIDFSNIINENKEVLDIIQNLKRGRIDKTLSSALEAYDKGIDYPFMKVLILSTIKNQTLSAIEINILKKMIEQNDLPIHKYIYQNVLSIKNLDKFFKEVDFEMVNKERLRLLIKVISESFLHQTKVMKELFSKLINYQGDIPLNKDTIRKIYDAFQGNFQWECIALRWKYQVGNIEKIIEHLHEIPDNKREKILIYLSKIAYDAGKNLDSIYFAQMAYDIDPLNKTTLRRLISAHHRAGNLTERLRFIQELKAASGKIYSNELVMAKDEMDLLMNLWKWKSRPLNVQHGDEIIHVLNKSWDISTNGYTIRSQQIVNNQINSGFKPVVVTKLGWPAVKGKSGIQHTVKDGVDFFHLYGLDSSIQLNKIPMSEYFQAYADEFANFIELRKPKVIHAASNFQNALPALAVAKSAGIHSVYEVRGMWHHTQSSKTEGFENSERFKLQEKYEVYCCQLADRVVAICESLKKHLIELGVDPSKIDVVPNGVDLGVLVPQPKDSQIVEKYNLSNKVVLGFIGSVTAYEGLDYLFQALATLKADAKDKYAMVLVGDGEALPSLKELAKKLSIDDIVHFIGRVPHSEVSKYYSVIDIMPFPRTKAKVCELVTPLKPYEAMAMEKIVLVSDIPALREMVIHDQTGLIFEAENTNALVESILTAETKLNLCVQSRKWVEENRNWSKLINRYNNVYH